MLDEQQPKTKDADMAKLASGKWQVASGKWQVAKNAANSIACQA
jgi:hypothetical protein